MTLGLALLVRDGSTVAPRCLQSVRPHIDHWTVAYSGQEDDVTTGIRESLEGIPGTLTLRPFTDIASNRTAVLKDARGTADYILHLDDDHELKVTADPGELTAEVYMVEQRQGTLAWRMPHVLRGDRDWRYAGGPAHEYLEYDQTKRASLDGLHLIHHADGENDPAKLEKTLSALQGQLAANPTDARSAFYLANTLRDLGRWQEAIEAYRARLTMPGWDEENFYARYQLGCLLAEHRDYAEGARELLAAWEMRPQRMEPLRALANAANDIADRAPLTDDLLFVHPGMYGKH